MQVRCIQLAVDNPAAHGEMRVYNQITEQFSVNDIAQIVQREGGKMGLDVQVGLVGANTTTRFGDKAAPSIGLT